MDVWAILGVDMIPFFALFFRGGQNLLTEWFRQSNVYYFFLLYFLFVEFVGVGGTIIGWAGDRTHEWGWWWLLRSKSKLQTLSFSPPLHVFLQKKAFFRFCGRDPSKMTILAPSRKPVRIGLYRGVEKGPKSTFSGWSIFGFLDFLEDCKFSSTFSIHYRL